MRVTLIIPPSGFLLDERVFPSLGILKVASALEQGGVDVDVWDLSGVEELHKGVHDFLCHRAPSDVYGITATMPQMPAAALIADQIKTTRRAWLILGGPHVTLLNASAKQEAKREEVGRATIAMHQLLTRFDCLVCGDGERAIWNAIVPIRLNQPPEPLIDADEPSSTLFLGKDDLNEAPFPARHLIDLNSYHYAIDGYVTHSLIGQLGCPFGCAFCGGRRSPFLRRVRTRSTQNVIAEVRHLHDRWGARGMMFLDDELNVNTLFMELLDALSALQDTIGEDLKFRGLLKSQLVTDDMAAAMARTGFRQILVGFESGDERILRNMNKQATRDQNTRCVELLRKHGIKVKALMSVGHAGESETSVEATRRWLLDVQPDDFDVTVITVYPGTPYYDDARAVAVGQGIPGKFHRTIDFMLDGLTGTFDYPDIYTYTDAKNGDRLHAVSVDHLRDVNFYKGVPGQYRSFVWTDSLSRSDLVTLRDAVEADVRRKLGIPYPQGPAEKQYEHSMGLR